MTGNAISGRRAKYATLLLLVVGSGLALLAATQTWFTVHLTDVANHVTTITVAGSAAAPALTALALAGLALTAALAIAGPAFRIVLGLLGILLGVSVVFSAVSAVADPFRAASAAITSATGVAGQASVRKLVDQLDTAFWPWLGVAGGVVVVLASAAAIVTLRLWPGPSRKYQTRFQSEDGRSAEEALAEVSDADMFERGVSDGEVSDAEEARAVAEGETTGEPSALDRDTAIDSWDELSRGDDPTR